jgi:protein-S-isoprenylcysteine O-methyltransferase Ste14
MRAINFKLVPWLRCARLVIGETSLFLLIWTEIELGRQFSPQLQLRQEHKLITSGPYAYLRHPLYTVLDAFGLSLPLVNANWFFTAFFILSLLGLAFRSPKEERMMLEHFVAPYRIYMQRTGRFLPKQF